MKTILTGLIKLYQNFFSPEQGILVKSGIKKYKHTCVFYPTCSDYAIIAIEKYGVIKGVFFATKRLLRCNPFTKHGGVDKP